MPQPQSRTGVARQHPPGHLGWVQAPLPLHHGRPQGAQVGGGPQVAPIQQLGLGQARPIGPHPATGHRTTRHQSHAARAVVGAAGAVEGCGAAKLGHHHHRGLVPKRFQGGAQGQQALVQGGQQALQTPRLLGVGVPTVHVQPSHPWPGRG